MAEVIVRFDLKFTNRAVRWTMVGAMLLAAAPELASESVSLTTYYPAPSGVYTQIIGTSNSFMARDTGYLDVGTATAPGGGTKMAVMNGNVGIGTLSPSNLLEVDGGGTAFSVIGGSAGIGTTAAATTLEVVGTGGPAFSVVGGNAGIGTTGPTATLQVVGTGGGNVNFVVNGRMQTGDGGASGGIWLDSSDNIFIGQNGSDIGLYTAGAGWVQTIDQSGITEFVGKVETANVLESDQNCGEITFAPNANSGCGGYITTATGIYSRYMTLPMPTSATSSLGTFNSDDLTINALCCACPTGGCNL